MNSERIKSCTNIDALMLARELVTSDLKAIDEQINALLATGYRGDDDTPSGDSNDTMTQHARPCEDGCQGTLYDEEAIECTCECHKQASTAPTQGHTPGPWLIADDSPLFVYALDENQEVNRFDLSIHGGYRFGVRGGKRTTQQELEANARLIAAAPETAAERDSLKAVNAELLAALQVMVAAAEIDQRRGLTAIDTTSARAAIAKATGKQ